MAEVQQKDNGGGKGKQKKRRFAWTSLLWWT